MQCFKKWLVYEDVCFTWWLLTICANNTKSCCPCHSSNMFMRAKQPLVQSRLPTLHGMQHHLCLCYSSSNVSKGISWNVCVATSPRNSWLTHTWNTCQSFSICMFWDISDFSLTMQTQQWVNVWLNQADFLKGIWPSKTDAASSYMLYVITVSSHTYRTTFGSNHIFNQASSLALETCHLANKPYQLHFLWKSD